jgi:hypothetical protein
MVGESFFSWNDICRLSILPTNLFRIPIPAVWLKEVIPCLYIVNYYLLSSYVTSLICDLVLFHASNNVISDVAGAPVGGVCKLQACKCV